MGRAAQCATGLIIVLLLVLALEDAPFMADLKGSLQVLTVPTSMLKYGPMGKILNRLGVLVAVPNDFGRFPASEGEEPGFDANIFQKKRNVGEYLFEALPRGGVGLPSSFKDDDIPSDPLWPVLSLSVKEEDFYGESQGIISNYREKGRDWERLAYVSYYEGGRLLFSSGCGLRLHGGKHREANHSYRLYFRRGYGADQFGPGLLFGPEAEPVRTIVVRRKSPVSRELTTALSFAISRRAGAVTPDFRMVMVYLNGRRWDRYTLIEHLGRRQWESHVGHKNFLFYRYKGASDEESEEGYALLSRWASDTSVRMTMEDASKRVDLDNLCRHLLSIAFCGTTDWRQGVAVLDSERPETGWHWVNWDMDHSFIDVHRKKRNPYRSRWEQEAFELVARTSRLKKESVPPPSYEGRDVREVIFERLWRESPPFRAFFARLVMDTLNHRLSAAYFESLIADYGRYSREVKGLGEFLAKRPSFLRGQMTQYFDAGDTYKVRVEAPPRMTLEVDGFEEGPLYEGVYFSGSEFSVEVQGEGQGEFEGWIVNGEEARTRRLTFPVDRDIHIETIRKL